MPLGIPLYASLAALWRLGAVVVFPEPALGLAGPASRGGRNAGRRPFSPADGSAALRYVLPGCGAIPMLIAGRRGRLRRCDGDRVRCRRPSGADLLHQRLDRAAQDHRAQPRLPRQPERLRRRSARSCSATTRSISSRFRSSCSPISASASPRCCPNWNLRRHDERRRRPIAATSASTA